MIMAWIIAVTSTVLFVICTYWTIQYPGSIDELTDKLQRVKRTYPVIKLLIIAVISWVFIIAF